MNVQLFPLQFFRFGIFHAEAVNGDAFDFLLLQRPVRFVGCGFGNAVYGVHTLRDFPKCGIRTVEMRRFFMHDKKLTAGGVGEIASRHR